MVIKKTLFVFLLSLVGLFSGLYFFKPVQKVELSSRPSDCNVNICSLPRNVIKDEVYLKYCGASDSCQISGSQCTNSSDCCSGVCSNGVCKADSKNKIPNQYACESSIECKSLNCDYDPNQDGEKICMGSRGEFCSFRGEICNNNSNCCSNNCQDNICYGSSLDKTPNGGQCFQNHSECLSNYCNLDTHRCE